MRFQDPHESEQWDVVRSRIGQISWNIFKIDVELAEDAPVDQETLVRLEGLQDKSESVMQQLAVLDDESDRYRHSIREAKEEFRNIVRRYRKACERRLRQH